MSSNHFRLSIGAKRQVTLPAELLEQLQVPERGELQIEVIGDVAVLTPMVSVPRTQLPEELRRTFESRRGAQPSDIPLAQFLKEIGYKAPQETAAAPRHSAGGRLAGFTENEKQALSRFIGKSPAAPAVNEPSEVREPGLTERERQVLDQIAQGRTNRQIGATLKLAEATVKRHLENIEQKLGKPARALRHEVRSTGR